jgi:hypothetical protein
VAGVLAHGGGQLFHAGGGFFQRGGLFFGALREVEIALRDLATGHRNGLGRRLDAVRDHVQLITHLLDGSHQAGTVAIPQSHGGGEIAGGDVAGDGLRFGRFGTKLAQDAARDHGRGGHADQQRQATALSMMVRSHA